MKNSMKNSTKNMFLFSLLAAVLILPACETLQRSGQKEAIGGVGGAVLGGLAGSQVGSGSGQLWATGAGALLGALAGSEVGRSLDKADRIYARQANERALSAPVGETIAWNNPETGNSGTVTPTRDGYSASGRYCREYQQKIMVDGQEQTAYGTACRQPDGSWEIVGS